MAMDWDKLRIFHVVAEAGSFTRAGRELNLSQSAVSRQISTLEKNLKVSLFHRHARGLLLTEQGELLDQTARDVFGKLAIAEAQLLESKERPKGSLKITSTLGFGSIWLAPRMTSFIDLYPEIKVQLFATDKELDLSMREADVAIRPIPPRQSDLIQRHLMTFQLNIYASAAYLKKHGAPNTLDDLDHHRLIAFEDTHRSILPELNWILSEGCKGKTTRRATMTINNVYGLKKAAETGAGLTVLPDFITMEPSDLVQVLPKLNSPQLDLFFVYPEEMRSSNRIAVFRDFLLRQVANMKTNKNKI